MIQGVEVEDQTPIEVEGVEEPTKAEIEEYSEEDEDELKKVTHNHDDIVTDPPMRATVIGPLYFNHVTSFIGIVFLWGLSTWCMIDPEGSREILFEWRGDSTQYFSWFYIGTRPVFFFFIIYIGIKFGDIRLGPQDSKPEFSTLTYFTMLFAAGVAVGLFFYGVAEPLWHRNSHFFEKGGYHSQDEIDQYALTITYYHWGIAGWAGYIIVALAVGIAAYRFKLPMTFRSGLFPILGPYTWGWIGDFIDGFTIVVTVAGVCTSLGLGASQILTGLQRIKWLKEGLTEDESRDIEIAIIWVITVIATISVVSGLDVGIKFLSNVAFLLGNLLLLWALVGEQTAFSLNLLVQSVGQYLHHAIFYLNFWTDAFGQLRTGEGRDDENRGGAVWWMDSWTIFYMAWWTAWSGFVGIFVARISKGRTVGEVCFFGTVVPLIYIFMWFSVFGGAGLRQARQAEELETLGMTYYNNSAHFQNSNIDYCYDVPQENLEIDGKVVFENNCIGVTPVCKFNPSDDTNAWFNVLFSFSYPKDFDVGYGYFLSFVSIIALCIYFITSSDSGSLIVDHLASNGKEEHFWGQRVFWAFTEGAVASALLVAGGPDALRALQAGSILTGLPFTAFMCYMMESIYIMCKHAHAYPDSMTYEFGHGQGAEFNTPVYGGIFNIFEYLFSFTFVDERRVSMGIDKPTSTHVSGFFKNAFLPMIALYNILGKSNPKSKISNIAFTLLYTFFFAMWIGCFAAVGASYSLRMFGWTGFFGCGMLLTSVKNNFREKNKLRGNVIGDWISSMFVYPQVLVQLEEQSEILGLPYETDE